MNNIVSFLKTSGKDNGIFTYELNGEWEHTIARLYYRSVSGGMEGISVNYDLVRDFANENDWNAIEIFDLMRSIAARVKE